MDKSLQEVLHVTQEECAEVSQSISKIFRFGLNGEYQNRTNLVRLSEEVGDLYCMIELMIEKGLVRREDILASAAKKREKLKVWSSIFEGSENA